MAKSSPVATTRRLGGVLRSAAVALTLAGSAAAQPALSPWAAPAARAPSPGAAAAAPSSSAPSPWDAPAPARGANGQPTPSIGVDEILVTKHLAGPSIWKASKGDAQVFILGAATPLPHMLEWDTLRVENELSGADALYLPARPTFSAFELMKLALNKGALQLPGGQRLETVLPPPEKARFLRLLTAIHAKPETYDRWKPAIAGLFLIGDWRKAAGLSEAKPGSTVMHLAEDAHVPVRYVGDFKLDPYVATAAKLSAADNLACFKAAMDDVDREISLARPTAEAWAKGDLKTVGQNYKASLLDGCLERIPTVQGLLDRGTAEGVDTIEAALAKPGKSVAVIDLNFLLRPNGVLQRLQAKGVTVSVPD